jgi:hypothetical protein
VVVDAGMGLDGADRREDLRVVMKNIFWDET